MAESVKDWIALLPSPGMGHLIPLIEFAKALRRFGLGSTFFIPTEGPLSGAQHSVLSKLPSSVDCVLLPPVDLGDLPLGVKIETRISVHVARSLGSLRNALESFQGRRKFVALVVDLFGTDGFKVSREMGIQQYIFFPSTAMLLSLFLHSLELDKSVVGEYRELPEKIQIPGCTPIYGRDLVSPFQDRKNDAYKWFLHHSRRFLMADGIVINTFKELEPKTIKALQEKGSENPVLYPIGPLINRDSEDEVDDPSECLKWLDEQPKDSVLFISFGSGGTLSRDQLIEVAMGLELSDQRFLWVIRCPSDRANAGYFGMPNADDPTAYLPDGFLERTKNRALVVPFWAPQARVLAHDSICAFLTHCGWNSTLESLVNGVPLIAWPLYAEQRMNAVMLNEEVKVALRPQPGENGLVDRLELANVVRNLMEGEEGKRTRNRMGTLKDAAAQAFGTDGTSTKTLEQLAKRLKNTCAALE